MKSPISWVPCFDLSGQAKPVRSKVLHRKTLARR
nr:MAG TPA: hypothetical protein [Caudoviricetes sp.]